MKIKDEILRTLQDKNMDEKATDEDGNTLIHQILHSEEVTEKDAMKLLQLLLDRRVDPNIKNAREKTALHSAVEKRMKGVVDILIKHGARMDVTDKYGNSIAHHFVENEYFNCPYAGENSEIKSVNFAKFMISRGFDFDRKNGRGETALHQAASRCHLHHILLALLEHAHGIGSADEYNRTLLHLVFVYGRWDRNERVFDTDLLKEIKHSRRVKIVKLLLERGIPVETFDTWGRTALHSALSSEEDMQIIEMIGDRLLGACQDSAFATRLFLELVETCTLWSTSGIDYYFKMLRTLIKKGCDVNVKHKTGKSALHFAARHPKNASVVRLLIDSGCDVNAKEERGWPVLHYALYFKNISVVHLLVEFGCDVNAKGEYGNLALHVAAHRLRDAGVIRLLIESGAVVDSKNEYMDTPLLLAVKNEDAGGIKVVKLLLESGANVNSRDAAGRTALSHVASGWDIAMLKLLLKRGAFVNALDRKWKTALRWALSNETARCWALSDDTPASVKELLKYGADVNEVCVARRFKRDVSSGTKAFIDKYCIKLKAAKLHCSDDNRRRYGDGPKYRKHYKECLKEVETLKTTFISSRTSLYDFLHKSMKARCAYINNGKLQDLIGSPALEKTFPKYADIILASYRETVARKSLLERAKLAWLELTEIHLPDICIERILDYLSDADLINTLDEDKNIV